MTERLLTVKAAGDWELDVLAIPYGGPNDRDSDGEWFSSETNLWDEQFPAPPVVYYHGIDPQTKQPTGTPEVIGRSVSREKRSDGVWVRVVLDKANEWAQRVWQAAKDGIAVASSGSIVHLARIAPDGHIRNWPLAELSIWDNDGSRPQANRHAVALPAMKAVYRAAHLELPVDIESTAQGGDSEDARTASVVPPPRDPDDSRSLQKQESSKMDEIQKAVAEALKAEREAQRAEREAETARETAIAEAVKAERAKWDEDAAKARRLPSGDDDATKAPAVVDSSLQKYDHMETGDLALTIQVLREAYASNRSKRGISDAAVKALAMRLESIESRKQEGFQEALGLMKAQTNGMKANELNQSTLASYGDEWVGVAYGNALWETIRHGTPILDAQMAFAVPQPAGAETMYFPLESVDPTWYLVSQASALSANPGGIPTNTVTASKLGTAQQSRTMAKIGARTLWTGEMEEDSVVSFASELRRQLSASGMEMLESLLIDGDTAAGASTNINDIAGTPAGTEYWMGINGYRKLALVTNTANSRDGGAIAVGDYLETLKLMGLAGKNALGSDRVAFIPDLWTYWKSLELAEVITQDKNSQATVENGQLMRMWGFPVLKSVNMHKPSADTTYGLKADATGKIDQDTASNNAKGALLAVRWDQWRPGYRRQMTIETTRVPAADATEIVALLRFGMIYRDIEASAISYNLTV